MRRYRTILLVVLCLSLAQFTAAQTPADTASALPRLVRFGGAVKSPDGSPLTGVAGITFALYAEQTGGAPLWLETQNVTADSSGRYTVLLGATKTEGLPAELFTSERAHWVGVQVQGQPEQPRVLLVSAPYALKAGDAETIGGLPPSAFVLAAPMAGGSVAAGAPGAPAASAAVSDAAPATATDVTTTGGTVGYLPYFTGAATVLDSVVSQSGSGSTAQVHVGGELKLAATGAATSTTGYNSEPLDLAASVFNSSTSTSVPQTFQLQAEPVGNDTTTASGVLSLLYGSGTAAPAETGLQIASNGVITFASGQTLPAVTGSVDMTGNLTLGGGVTATTTVSASTIQGAVVQATGSVSGSGFYTLGNQLLCGNYNDQDTVVGFGALNSLCSGSGDGGSNTAVGFKSLAGAAGGGGTAVGAYALSSSPVSPDNTALGAYALGRLGSNGNAGYNTASGAYALYNNQAGGYNTASGYNALLANGQSTGGNNNAAYGFQALENNSSGSNNTGVGYCAGAVGTFCSTGNPNMTGSSNTFVGSQAGLSTSSVVNNATAIGANAAVGASNALVLGSIAGVNGATASTSVGIGTPTPGATLEVNGTAMFDGLVTFAPGQTFPGAGSGTVTSITAGSGLTASSNPITTSGTLSIAPNLCPANQALIAFPFACSPFATLGTNTFTANQTVSGSLSVTGAGSFSAGVSGVTSTVSGNAVYGYNSATSGSGTNGVYGTSSSPSGSGVVGVDIAGTTGIGVYGQGSGYAGYFQGNVGVGGNMSVQSSTTTNAAVQGTGFSITAGSGNGGPGISGYGGNSGSGGSSATGGPGISGYGGTGAWYGNIDGFDRPGTGGAGGVFSGGSDAIAYGHGGDGIDATAGTGTGDGGVNGYAGDFSGNLNVSGAITAGTKDFRIDHPLDPANKYLLHASVESSEMKNIYDGNVTTDGQGLATVLLPDWFEALNTDFRYQLTVIGQFAQAIVSSEVANHQFSIRTDKPSVKVSWQITGVRRDAYAKANPLVVEQEKESRERGYYIHPELYGAPEDRGIEWARHPETMKHLQELRSRQLEESQ